ncbi:pogo transposable element with ZNF domain isoform X3 [Brachyhypopomus gauderio]|uniref:pogo transposable element with ZNF domain isoform X3 n=1 Tax=Brachyhypopomus gauderio TaxID=698409 RepID=UPI00404149DD
MEDADLFMECEEEELEPWQQMNQNEPDETLPTVESKISTGPATAIAAQPVSTPVVIPSMPASNNNVTTVPLLTSALPTGVPAGLPKATPGQQLILTQGAGGLAPVALSQVILPGTSPASSAAGGQPIYFTTQGIPVQNIQSSQSPMGIVLNVQQGQTVRPITLVPASGTTGLFKPAIGAAQVIAQPAQMRPAPPVVNRAQAPSAFTTVQIPATLTIRSNVPASQPRAPPAPSAAGPHPSTPPRVLPVNTATQLVTVKPEGNLDVQNLMSIVNLPAGGPPQTFVVMSNQKTNCGSPAVQATVPVVQSNTSQVTSAAQRQVCPRCCAQFKMVEALRGHMCFCCPDMTRNMSTSNATPVTKPQTVQDKGLNTEIKTESLDIHPEETQSKIVMLVDDFYYGTFEGNRVYVHTDNIKELTPFKCFTCGKPQKNNIRLMNHMMLHMEMEQQAGEMKMHTSCRHCFRQFPTPFRLQCHVESVHSPSDSTSRCKICEWAFESEPVFLQHMKNTHKPGEMPYVCQVCQYRSSFYSDVHDHFCTWHEDTRHLLCVYCLKVFKNSSSYQLHFNRHQKSTLYHCNKCRLQFLFTKEKVEHKVNHHKTFRKPSQLEGLKAGTKVTIRAYAGQKKSAGQMKVTRDSTHTEGTMSLALHDEMSPTHIRSTSGQTVRVPKNTGAKKKQVRKMHQFLSRFQEHRGQLGRHKCVECTFAISHFGNHYPTYVHCSLCPYSTCCSRAYANHMINNHVPGRALKARTKKGSLSWLRLTCECCNYKTSQGDLMAKHLVQFPSHSHSIFTLKGNPKTGFVERNRPYLQPAKNSSTFRSFPHGSSIDSSVTSLEDTTRNKKLDHEMAPLDLSDSDLETENSSQHAPIKMEDGHEVSKSATKPDSSKTTKEREETLSVRQLRILLYALCSGIHKAAKEMDTKPQLIRAWLQDKEKRLNDEGVGSCSSGEAVELLVEWVLAEREQQHPISEKNLFQKASEIHSQTTPSSSFRISYEWAVNFMLQHKLALHSFDISSFQLPRSMEENRLHFIEFVHRQIKTHSIPHFAVGAMDELSVFVDFDALVKSSTTSNDAVFRLEGTGKPYVNIYLSVLADGTMLPAMLFFKGTTLENVSKELPDSVILEASTEGFSETEELELWTARVWKQYLRSQNGDKAMLVIDGHHGHMSEDFLSTVSGTKTLPVIIPSGCTGQCQPLEMCVRPVLQKFLLARWTQFVEQGRVAEIKAEDLVWLLVTWLEEALAYCCGRADLIEYSFFFSHVITEQQECKREASTRLELINMLTEAMLGTVERDPEPLAEEQSTEGVMEKPKSTLCKESHSKEEPEEDRKIVDAIQAEARTATESNRTEQQAQERMNKDLEASKSCSSLLPYMSVTGPT